MTDRSSALTITARPDSTRPNVLKVSGELDHHTAPQLRETLNELAVADGVVLDLTDLAYCDSSGITVLVSAHQRAQAEHSAVLLVGLDPDLVQHFRILGLGGVFSLHTTVEDAVRSLRA